ncbi:MAG: SDR family oxidoreductase UcpA [Bacilli bacterium]
MKLDGKIAYVTGGAMGNGLGIVKMFLKYGATVIIADYNKGVFEVEEVLKEKGYPVKAYLVDIRNQEEVNESVREVIAAYGRIDILVNNAGVAKLKRFIDMTDEERDYHFDINIKGSWNVTKAVLPYMVDNKYGKIINLSSVTGPMVADPGEVAYATTKAALIGFTKSLAREYAEDNINVNAIMPGYIKTPMVSSIATDSNYEDPRSVIEGIAAAIPMGRLGKINELGELAAFLASEESSYITGQGIVIDGGSTLPETISVGN